jgi:hypothetical protein
MLCTDISTGVRSKFPPYPTVWVWFTHILAVAAPSPAQGRQRTVQATTSKAFTNPKPQILHLKVQTLTPELQTLNSKLETLNPDP